MAHLQRYKQLFAQLLNYITIFFYNCQQFLKILLKKFYAFNFSINSSTSIPCTSHASSIVSSCEAGHPRQCIPASNNIFAFSGAIFNKSPIFVVFFFFLFPPLKNFFIQFLNILSYFFKKV